MINKITAVYIDGHRIEMDKFDPQLLMAADRVEIEERPPKEQFRMVVLDIGSAMASFVKRMEDQGRNPLGLYVDALKNMPVSDRQYDWELVTTDDMKGRLEIEKVINTIYDDEELTTPIKIRRLVDYMYNPHIHAEEDTDIAFIEMKARNAIKGLKMKVVECQTAGCDGDYHPNTAHLADEEYFWKCRKCKHENHEILELPKGQVLSDNPEVEMNVPGDFYIPAEVLTKLPCEAEYENAKKIIKQYEDHQRKMIEMRDRDTCSKCGGTAHSQSWEAQVCGFDLTIGVPSQSHKALWGDDSDHYYPHHPAYKDGANNTMQQVHLKSSHSADYKLCMSCHSKFVKTIGDFLKPNP